MDARKARQKGRRSSWDSRLEYRLLVATSFAVCLAMVAGQRVMRALRGRTANVSGESVFAEARSAAHAAAGYAFIA